MTDGGRDSAADLGTIETRIPSRLDRLPWSQFHWMIVIGLGTVWILDGLEVTIVGSIGQRLTEKGSGLVLDASQIGTAAAFYVAGACVGALFFGQLTDRFGRKKLFLLTLGVYIVATIATAFSFSPLVLLRRALLHRRRHRRRVRGDQLGDRRADPGPGARPGRPDDQRQLLARRRRRRPRLDRPARHGALRRRRRLAARLRRSAPLLGVGILLVRRNVPESPRWLFIHGREEEAEEIVGEIEHAVEEETGEELSEADDSLTVKQRERIPFREIARTAFTKYPRRTVLGLALFVGQAFLYNAVTFDLGTLLGEFFDVASGTVPIYIAIFALSNFLGPLMLGRLFDTVGRKPMVTFTYLGSAALTAVLGDPAARQLADHLVVHGLRAGDLLPRLGRRQLRLPDRQRDLPDGDAGALDRLLLRGRHGGGRHRRPAALRPPDRQRQPGPGRDRLLHRRRGDGDRRHRRAALRGQGGAEAARGHRRRR